MSVFTWKNTNHINKKHDDPAVADLFNFVAGMRISTKNNKGACYQHALIVNEDGLQDREAPLIAKRFFKDKIMKRWHDLAPVIPRPFTGKIEVNVHNLKIEEVRFITK